MRVTNAKIILEGGNVVRIDGGQGAAEHQAQQFASAMVPNGVLTIVAGGKYSVIPFKSIIYAEVWEEEVPNEGKETHHGPG